MVAPVLQTADLALLADDSQRVLIPHLIALAPTRAYPTALVTFAGDTLPTPFRGLTRPRSFRLTCRYGHNQHPELLALLALLETAAAHPDPRLLLRTHVGTVAGLDDVTAVVVTQVDPVPQPGRLTEVSLTCEAVAWTEGV